MGDGEPPIDGGSYTVILEKASRALALINMHMSDCDKRYGEIREEQRDTNQTLIKMRDEIKGEIEKSTRVLHERIDRRSAGMQALWTRVAFGVIAVLLTTTGALLTKMFLN